MPAEGVLYCDDEHVDAVFGLQTMLYCSGAKCGQVAQKMAILLEDWPENVWHREYDARVWNVWKGSPLFPLPQQSGSMSTTRASSRFAGRPSVAVTVAVHPHLQQTFSYTYRQSSVRAKIWLSVVYSVVCVENGMVYSK